MAKEIALNRPEVFPKGTVVKLYAAPGAAPNTGNSQTEGPTGPVIKEKEVEDDTVGVVFTGLSDTPSAYIAIGKVGSAYRRVRCFAGKLGQSLTPPARFPTHSA